ncbi:MAG: lysophospholipid acyltransferase family protein [Patescibacteria group bacterium]|nr:lysophospholipid acyltransferase family protein [Patescibacteria group bacterium]
MKITAPWIHRIGGLLSSAAVRAWMSTLDYKVAYGDPAVDPIFPQCRGQKIYIFWHEYILCPLFLRGHCNFAMLLSRHRDAEVLSHVAHHLGFEFVRGSTNRGGVAALRELLRKSQQMHLTITPDGPRGPRRRLAPGAVFLASKLELPLVVMGYGYDRPWRARSWDRFAVPRPCSRARVVASGEIFIPPKLDRDGLEHFRVEIETLLNSLTLEAEAWAESGTRKVGQRPLQRRGAPLRCERGNVPIRLTGPRWVRPEPPTACHLGSSVIGGVSDS